VILPFGALGRILREAMRFFTLARIHFWYVMSPMAWCTDALMHPFMDFFLTPGRRSKLQPVFRES